MESQSRRIVFLDTTRTLVVLFVVVLHAACAYAEIIPWWPVQEFPKPAFYSAAIIFFDLFCMPVLFFIAGFFGPGALRRHGPGGFAKAKLRRLGIPLVLLGLFYVPIMAYVGYAGRTPSAKGFFSFWLFQLSTAWKPDFALLDSMEKAIPRANDFSQWHLWFISLLLVFFLVHALVARIWPGLSRPAKNTSATGREILLSMFCAGLVAALLVAATNMLVPDWAWATVGGYLMLQPTRLGLYAVLFCLGILASNRRWFRTSDIPGSLWLWLGAALALDAAFFATAKHLMATLGPAPTPLALANGTLRAFTCLAWLAVLVKSTRRWANTPRAVRTSLSKSSYDIYLLHLPVVVGLQLAALALPVDYFAKFVLESLLGICMCWLLSRKLAAPHPKAAVAALGAVFLAACLFLQ